MAPAPPGNESPDWLILSRSVTSRPRAPPRPRAPAQSAAGRQKARSHCGGEGEKRPAKAVRKPAKCSFRRPRGWGRGKHLSSPPPPEGGRGSASRRTPPSSPRQCPSSTRLSAQPSAPSRSQGCSWSHLPLCVPGHLRYPPFRRSRL